MAYRPAANELAELPIEQFFLLSPLSAPLPRVSAPLPRAGSRRYFLVAARPGGPGGCL